MSEFEFVLVTVAIVAGFAISTILAGWSRSLLADGEARYSGLQFLASLVLLFETVRYIWTLWPFRSIEWFFWNFALALTPILVIALAAHVISIPGRGADPYERYFGRARPFFLLQVAVIVLWTLFDLINMSVVRSAVSAEVHWIVFVSRGAAVPAFLWLAYTKRRSHHWVVLGGALAILGYFGLRSLPTLPQ